MPTKRESDFRSGPWHSVVNLAPESFVCGYCENRVSSAFGFFTNQPQIIARPCPHCQGLTLFGHN